MPAHWWYHAVQQAAHEKEHTKVAGVILIIFGFFTAPLLIGIPIMLLGFYKLLR
jgi:hypothetical protein